VEKFIRRREDESEVHVLLDLGARRSQVVIGKGREISFYKPVEVGAVHLHDAVARKLEITLEEARALRRRLIESASDQQESRSTPDAVRQAVHDATRGTIEELAKEISLCLRYYSVTFRGQRPARVRVVGGEATDPHVLGILSEALPISVEAGQPLVSVNTAAMTQADRRGCMGEWAVAFGLGLKMTQGYFGARDGKRREPANAGHSRGPGAAGAEASAVEVIDIAQHTSSTSQEGAHA
jgi:type IV pilus assembly protein PilM